VTDTEKFLRTCLSYHLTKVSKDNNTLQNSIIQIVQTGHIYHPTQHRAATRESTVLIHVFERPN